MSPEDRAAKQAEWNADMAAHWLVQNGELVNDGQGVFLTTEQSFGDYELLLEYKTVPLADSGIYLKATPQVQIWDTREEGGKWNIGADKGSGGLWNNKRHERFPLIVADRPFGAWNAMRIRQIGARTTVYMNDHLIVDHVPLENYFAEDRPLFAEGPIQLQTHGGEIRFRNVYVRELPVAEANSILAHVHHEGFTSLFNGQDLTGWSGPTDNYEVKDGAIQCKSGHGGTIYTEAEYGDFAVRLQFQLPPGGNNGLAIRYPGSGDTAYVGMCELQVLDNTAEQYAGLKAFQYHGSAYGMVPSHRGYLRPVGEWNFQEVIVKGSTIRVELNGFIILDTDLSTLSDAAREGHPGWSRTRGHFGFAGHNDPVRFRDVQIKPLDAAEG